MKDAEILPRFCVNVLDESRITKLLGRSREGMSIVRERGVL